MSLTKQYFDDWFVSIKQQDCSFSRTKKKSNHNKHIKGFSIARGTNIFRTRSDSYILAKKNLVSNNLRYNLTPRTCKFNPLWRNLGYNNPTQNQNVFQTTARNLLNISSINVKFLWIHSIGL